MCVYYTIMAKGIRFELNKILTEAGISPYELAQRSGLNHATIYKILSGETAENKIRKSTLKLIAEALGCVVLVDHTLEGGDFIRLVKVDEIIPAFTKAAKTMVGRAEKTAAAIGQQITTVPYKETEPQGVRTPDQRRIPVYSFVQAGADGFILSDKDFPTGASDHFEWADDTTDQNAWFMRCRGSSMEPDVKDGAYILISPNTSPRSGDICIFRFKTGDRQGISTLKKLQFDNGKYLLIPSNRDFEIVSAEPYDVEIVGVVIEVRYKRDPNNL